MRRRFPANSADTSRNSLERYLDRDADGSFVLLIDVPGKPVNVINRRLLTDLGEALTAVAAQPRVPVLVVRSGKKAGSQNATCRGQTTARALSGP